MAADRAGEEFLAIARRPEPEIAAAFGVPLEQVSARLLDLAERSVSRLPVRRSR